jgi:hypothetical protein
MRSSRNNVLIVQLDSTERSDIPPFGYVVDYLTFGDIHREVALRIVPTTCIDEVFVRPIDALSVKPSLEVECLNREAPFCLAGQAEQPSAPRPIRMPASRPAVEGESASRRVSKNAQ